MNTGEHWASIAGTIPKCDHCDWARRVMVEMLPGKDGKPWWLCPKCYEDGLKPTRVKVTTETEFYPVIPSTGQEQSWVLQESERVPIEQTDLDAKREVANFEKMTEGGAKVRPKQRKKR